VTLPWMELMREARETPSLTVTIYLPGIGSLAEAIAMRVGWEDERNLGWWD